ncbi:MAG: CBS domain-containing protein [Alphaproteobacteria bacterium]
MRAKDVMTLNVLMVMPDTKVEDIATLLLERQVSAVPVVDADGGLVGIVSEGDLIRRHETDTERRPSWWLAFMTSDRDRAREFVKVHGRVARDIMTRDVITVAEETELPEIVHLLESKRIKRVPVLRGGKLVGIVSRANLLHGLVATSKARGAVPAGTDRDIRARILATLSNDAGVRTELLNVIVNDGVVQVWGATENEDSRRAILLAAESIPGVREVEDKMGIVPPLLRATMWAE